MPVSSDDVYINYLDQIKTYLEGHKEKLKKQNSNCPALDEAITKVQDLKKLPTDLDQCYITQLDKDTKQ